jgi:hypothetical protein
MPSVSDLLSRVSDALDGGCGLAAVPAVVALLSIENLRPPNTDFHVGISFGFPLLVLVLGLAGVGVGVVAAPLLLLTLPLLLLGAYLFYPVPYLVITEDAALARSPELTGGGGPALSYFVQYALVTAALSVPATLVFVNLGLTGLVLGCVALAPVATVFDMAMMAFVRDLAGEDEPTDDGPTPAVTPV